MFGNTESPAKNIRSTSIINCKECSTQISCPSVVCMCDNFIDCLASKDDPPNNFVTDNNVIENFNDKLQDLNATISKVMRTLAQIQETLRDQQNQLNKHEEHIQKCCGNKNPLATGTHEKKYLYLQTTTQNYPVYSMQQSTCIPVEKGLESKLNDKVKAMETCTDMNHFSAVKYNPNLQKLPFLLKLPPPPPVISFSSSKPSSEIGMKNQQHQQQAAFKKFNETHKSVHSRHMVISSSKNTVDTLNYIAKLKKVLENKIMNTDEKVLPSPETEVNHS